jgi:cellulose synthase/poly-beta-1,6-N-acetylglucosamine synthase-like glycosyltransferase
MAVIGSIAPLALDLAPEAAAREGCACLILAHDESQVIEQALESVRLAMAPQAPVIVVADHCVDDTAERARRSGAAVLVRDGGSATGKGAALAWFIQNHWELVRQCPAVLILDADSRLAPDAGAALADIPAEAAVFQCRVIPGDFSGSPLAALIALSEIVDQWLDDRLRARLGWPVRLRGTGMLLPPAILREACASLETEVEDTALTLLLAAAGVKIGRLEKVVVYDPKPRRAAPAARQRARWFRGQWAALWRYRLQALRIARQGPPGWSLLGTLFLKPRWLVLAAGTLLALACSRWAGAAALCWSLVFLQAAPLVVGLFALPPEHRHLLRSFLYHPWFAFMWLRALALLFRRSSWLRTRS